MQLTTEATVIGCDANPTGELLPAPRIDYLSLHLKQSSVAAWAAGGTEARPGSWCDSTGATLSADDRGGLAEFSGWPIEQRHPVQLLRLPGKCVRIDLAVDVDNELEIQNQIEQAWYTDQVITRWRKLRFHGSAERGKAPTHTTYLGKRGSDAMLRCYPRDGGTRLELELRRRVAVAAWDAIRTRVLLQSEDYHQACQAVWANALVPRLRLKGEFEQDWNLVTSAFEKRLTRATWTPEERARNLGRYAAQAMDAVGRAITMELGTEGSTGSRTDAMIRDDRTGKLRAAFRRGFEGELED